ncbi:hypothetical protein CQA01_05500 [Cyclobacterium qasimii]|uniref:Uncharacterized protein n=1 Tax=Cyclobacterium qasimii TaxID=1350429 RepID=A0A512C724_9BACT|nr:hypothetical protein CQA01_05500 [Cyclobacterium qasimii]
MLFTILHSQIIRLIFEKRTYRNIAFAFLGIFLSLLFVPTIIVTAIDEDVNISMIFSFAEEETKENEVKSELDIDDFFTSNNFLPEHSFISKFSSDINFEKILTSLHSPGIIVPPPELS